MAVFDKFWSKFKHAPFQGRNVIVKAFCPQLYGMYYVKLCLLLSLIGGSIPKQFQRHDKDTVKGDCLVDSDSVSVKTRYQSHILLVGDPGCG